MWFIDQMVTWLGSVTDFFYAAFLEVRGWVWPFHYLSTPLWGIYVAFWWITYYFGQFNAFLDLVYNKIGTILSYLDITSYFKTFFDYALWAWDWISNAWGNVTDIVDSWWSSASLTVRTWIDGAYQFARSSIDQVNIWLSSLQVAWDNFKGMIPSLSEILAWFADWPAKILSQITYWGALPGKLIQDLINGTLKEWFPFYDTLAEIWSTIVEFFVDPLEFLLARFTDWFLGPEE